MGDMPPRLVLIENDDKGGVRSRPETVDAIGEVMEAWREFLSSPTLVGRADLHNALAALAERWPS